jgi:DNA-binding transcriptional regulator YiaG
MAAPKKLTPAQVKEVRIARNNGESQAKLAARLNVHTSTIRAAETATGAYASF